MNSGKYVLVTGGLGYIGSITTIALIESGYKVIIIDDTSNSKLQVLDRIEDITHIRPIFYNSNINNEVILKKIFSLNIDSIIHFAGSKSVPESISRPLLYYSNNISASLTLLHYAVKFNVNKFIFSSSATVYGNYNKFPISEKAPLNPLNPYGESKLIFEKILRDCSISNPQFRAISLRYFNPVGAHKSGKLGEDPKGVPGNLFPCIERVAIGREKLLHIFGDDYSTLDGTGVRDFIHVQDLSNGHLCALSSINNLINRYEAINLGTGTGFSVLQIVKAYSDINGVNIPLKICPRRTGDISTSYADPLLAKNLLNWESKLTLNDMCIDSWRWVNYYGNR